MFILRFADPGEILGLAGTLSGRPYEVWAEATQPTQTSFVKGEHFVDIIRRNAELAVHVAMHLGGMSRETVSRLLSGFKKKGLIQWKGCNLVLTDRAVLESLAAN